MELLCLEERLRTMLPDNYADVYKAIEPVPMRSAGLVYRDGEVAWDQIWVSFCDLAMAGGPPHRGRLLEPGTRQQIEEDREGYDRVLVEICRGVHMVTGLHAEPSPIAGWVRMYCTSAAMADWLVRAITMENITAHRSGLVLSLPAGPAFRIEKEIKNVITAVAKTIHYWVEHTSEERKDAIAQLIRGLKAEAPLLQPALDPHTAPSVAAREEIQSRLTASLQGVVQLTPSAQNYVGWIGFELGSIPLAIAVVRFLVVSNVLARRESTEVFVPLCAEGGPAQERLLACLTRAVMCASKLTSSTPSN